MEKEQLRENLKDMLWRINRLDIMAFLRQFAEGEMAVLTCLYVESGAVTPSQISDKLKISRARVANILKTLRGRGYVSMDMDGGDRRKMLVILTQEGRSYMKDELALVDKYIDLFVEEMGADAVCRLTELLEYIEKCQANITKKISP